MDTKTADKAKSGPDRKATTTITPTPKGVQPGKAGTSAPGNDKPEEHGPIDDVNYVDSSKGEGEGNDKVAKADKNAPAEPNPDFHGGWINGMPATEAELAKASK